MTFLVVESAGSALSWGSNVPATDGSTYLQQIGEFPKALCRLRFHESCSGWEYQSRGTMTISRIQDCSVKNLKMLASRVPPPHLMIQNEAGRWEVPDGA